MMLSSILKPILLLTVMLSSSSWGVQCKNGVKVDYADPDFKQIVENYQPLLCKKVYAPKTEKGETADYTKYCECMAKELNKVDGKIFNSDAVNEGVDYHVADVLQNQYEQMLRDNIASAISSQLVSINSLDSVMSTKIHIGSAFKDDPSKSYTGIKKEEMCNLSNLKDTIIKLIEDSEKSKDKEGKHCIINKGDKGYKLFSHRLNNIMGKIAPTKGKNYADKDSLLAYLKASKEEKKNSFSYDLMNNLNTPKGDNKCLSPQQYIGLRSENGYKGPVLETLFNMETDGNNNIKSINNISYFEFKRKMKELTLKNHNVRDIFTYNPYFAQLINDYEFYKKFVEISKKNYLKINSSKYKMYNLFDDKLLAKELIKSTNRKCEATGKVIVKFLCSQKNANIKPTLSKNIIFENLIRDPVIVLNSSYPKAHAKYLADKASTYQFCGNCNEILTIPPEDIEDRSVHNTNNWQNQEESYSNKSNKKNSKVNLLVASQSQTNEQNLNLLCSDGRDKTISPMENSLSHTLAKFSNNMQLTRSIFPIERQEINDKSNKPFTLQALNKKNKVFPSMGNDYTSFTDAFCDSNKELKSHQLPKKLHDFIDNLNSGKDGEDNKLKALLYGNSPLAKQLEIELGLRITKHKDGYVEIVSIGKNGQILKKVPTLNSEKYFKGSGITACSIPSGVNLDQCGVHSVLKAQGGLTDSQARAFFNILEMQTNRKLALAEDTLQKVLKQDSLSHKFKNATRDEQLYLISKVNNKIEGKLLAKEQKGYHPEKIIINDIHKEIQKDVPTSILEDIYIINEVSDTNKVHLKVEKNYMFNMFYSDNTKETLNQISQDSTKYQNQESQVKIPNHGGPFIATTDGAQGNSRSYITGSSLSSGIPPEVKDPYNNSPLTSGVRSYEDETFIPKEVPGKSSFSMSADYNQHQKTMTNNPSPQKAPVASSNRTNRNRSVGPSDNISSTPEYNRKPNHNISLDSSSSPKGKSNSMIDDLKAQTEALKSKLANRKTTTPNKTSTSPMATAKTKNSNSTKKNSLSNSPRAQRAPTSTAVNSQRSSSSGSPSGGSPGSSTSGVSERSGGSSPSFQSAEESSFAGALSGGGSMGATASISNSDIQNIADSAGDLMSQLKEDAQEAGEGLKGEDKSPDEKSPIKKVESISKFEYQYNKVIPQYFIDYIVKILRKSNPGESVKRIEREALKRAIEVLGLEGKEFYTLDLLPGNNYKVKKYAMKPTIDECHKEFSLSASQCSKMTMKQQNHLFKKRSSKKIKASQTKAISNKNLRPLKFNDLKINGKHLKESDILSPDYIAKILSDNREFLLKK